MGSQKRQGKTALQNAKEKLGLETAEGGKSGRGKPPRHLMALSGFGRHHRPTEADKVKHKAQEKALLEQLAKKRARLRQQAPEEGSSVSPPQTQQP